MSIVLQYTLVYCSKKGMRKAVCIAIHTGRAGGACRRRRAGRHGLSGRWARGALGTRGAGRRHAACAHLGALLGQQAVPLAHSACFDPVLTQYCS